MRLSGFLKSTRFNRNRRARKTVEFKGFLEGEFCPVFKNAEKRHESVLQPRCAVFRVLPCCTVETRIWTAREPANRNDRAIGRLLRCSSNMNTSVWEGDLNGAVPANLAG
jgi:hypothetical protein